MKMHSRAQISAHTLKKRIPTQQAHFFKNKASQQLSERDYSLYLNNPKHPVIKLPDSQEILADK